MANKKMTYVDALTSAIDALDAQGFDQMVLEKLIACRESYAKRGLNKGERKPSKKQVENQGVRSALVEFINEHIGEVEHGFTCSDLSKVCPAVEGASPQRISALLTQAHKAHEVSKVSVKRRTYFIPFTEEVTEEEEG